MSKHQYLQQHFHKFHLVVREIVLIKLLYFCLKTEPLLIVADRVEIRDAP